MQIYWLSAAVLLVNLPFGYWRTGLPRFSRWWFVAVHAPVPAVVALRLASGLGFKLATVPILVGAFFAGQFLGGRLGTWRRARLAVRQPGPERPPRSG